MHITNTNDITPISTPHGETVREYMGSAAGGSTQHSLAHITLSPSAASRRHYHPTAEESYFVLSGHGEVTIEGETRELTPGDAVAIPAGAVHQIRCAGPTDLVFLAVCVPPWTPDCSVYLD